MVDLIKQFIDDMAAHGNEPANAADIIPTGADWKRYQLAGDGRGKTNGYYRLKIDDGFAVGNHGNRRTGETITWHSKSERKWTDEEKAAWKARIEAEKRQSEEEARQAQSDAADKARTIWEAASPAQTHAYLEKKGIKAGKLRVSSDGLLLIPAYSDGKIVNLQRISPDGDKKFIWKAQISSTYCPIADAKDDKSVVVICEGYATGASIREAIGYPVAVAFSANNLQSVAQIMRAKYPKSKIIIAADNDAFTVVNGEPKNVGIDAGQKAAAKVNGFCIYPEFDGCDGKPTDFNDAHQLLGIGYVRDRIGGLLLDPSDAGGEGEFQADYHEPHDVQLPPAPQTRWEDMLMTTKRGDLDKDYSLNNCILFMTHHDIYRGCFVYDEFSHKVVIARPLPWDVNKFVVRSVTNNDLTRLRADFESRGIKISKGDISDAVSVTAENCRINPVREYMDWLKWDKKPRLDNWLIYYCGAESQDIEYVQRVGSCFLKAAVKRVYEPGAPFHHMMVLEGGQGAGKSTALKTLATFGDDIEVSYFTDKIGFESIDNKAIAEFINGHLIVEFQELSGLTKKDHNKVKSWITQTHDELQKKYQNEVTIYPRQWVLAGTTNDSHWLTDPTGNRRFWPIKVGDKIDVAALKRDRKQLWAEAVHRLKNGELWYINDDDPIYQTAKQEQAVRYVGDVWEDIIMTKTECWVHIRTEDILTEVLGVPKDRWDNRMRARIGSIMKSNGYDSGVSRIDGKNQRVWIKKDV